MTIVLSPRGIAVRDAMSDAPFGAYPLMEAAYAWHERRPECWQRMVMRAGPAAALAEIGVPQAASRFARLLIPTVWAKVTQSGGMWRVEVPAGAYRRSTRALTATWRKRTHLIQDAEAALGVWRMALLIADHELYPGQLAVRTSSPVAASLLIVSATRLGLAPSVSGRRKAPTVMIDRPCDVATLLRQATLGRWVGGLTNLGSGA